MRRLTNWTQPAAQIRKICCNPHADEDIISTAMPCAQSDNDRFQTAIAWTQATKLPAKTANASPNSAKLHRETAKLVLQTTTHFHLERRC